MFEILIKKIQSILTANTLLSEVYIYEAEEFKADPAAVVTPASNESSYNTIAENMRIYAFTIRLFVSRTSREKAVADEALRELVTSVLDDFDKDYHFAGLACPTGYTMINVFATPSAWGYTGREDEYRVAEVTVRCRVMVDVTAIS